ncbi:copper uptake system-associated protein [Maritimibacter sp. DP1N21-5]|uniref:copper uptake system-associated protein n=1 Tax=Maritimibacter sp. DP1N21-5 TaxID=2836867 RepID=UPI001C44C3FC|nr:copper uptake system-associated protein [Maritimibacter sp. DP1N21-5]MBV7407908.1 copper uptake system-associated protein [Maritimibacter sp. DP1N21-5]
MKTLTTALLGAFLAASAATPILAHEFKAGNIQIQHPYAFEAPPTAMSAGGYLTLVNEGETPDRLVAVEADFDRVMLHLSEEKDGVATMTHVEGIDIPAGETVALAPGGFHVMFMGLGGDPWEDGEKIPATLVFEQAGRVEVVFNVETREDAPENHDEMDHDGMDHDTMDHGADHSALDHDTMDHDTMDHAGHGLAAMDLSGLPDAEQIEAIMKAEFDRPEAPLSVAPVTIEGDQAVAGWRQDGTGGRAFLRKGEAGWMIVACAGDELLHSSTYERFGLSRELAVSLIEATARAEAGLPQAITAELNQFEGIVEIGAGGHHATH